MNNEINYELLKNFYFKKFFNTLLSLLSGGDFDVIWTLFLSNRRLLVLFFKYPL